MQQNVECGGECQRGPTEPLAHYLRKRPSTAQTHSLAFAATFLFDGVEKECGGECQRVAAEPPAITYISGLARRNTTHGRSRPHAFNGVEKECGGECQRVTIDGLCAVHYKTKLGEKIAE